jgi:phage gp29-like protein
VTTILDQYGKPINRAVLDEPQTSHIAELQNQYLVPMLGGLTPARLARTLQEADNGNLVEQHRLFADMEERDGHMRAEMDKRKSAVAGLDWDIVPPRNASAAEKAAAEWVKETLQDAVDPFEDLILALMDGVGHGFAPVELEWRKEGKELLPTIHPRPQEWFRLSTARTALRLRSNSLDGEALQPFGWIMHTHGKAKTGYLGRMGLFRTLVWPFLYKAYALGDFAEFLETFGLPIIVGKYHSAATADEKASLMRAVTALGHDARAIMPQEMQLEIQKIVGGSGDAPHLAMMRWAEGSESKSILGQTLSADTGQGGGGSYALGKVHNEVRHDICESDALQIAGTATRDYIYPLVALNRSGIEGLRRCPRLVFPMAEREDMKAYAESLPELVDRGLQVPVAWVHQQLQIPQPRDGEAVLTAPKESPSVAPGAVPAPAPSGTGKAKLSADVPAIGEPDQLDPAASVVDQLAGAAAPSWAELLETIGAKVDGAADLAALQQDLLQTFGGQPQEQLVKLMAAGFALAELKGMVDVQDGA